MNTSPSLNKYLSVKEVAALLNIAEKTVRKYVWLKTIPYIKIGGHVRFDYNRLQAWIDHQNVPTLEEIQFGSSSSHSRNGRKNNG